MRELTVILQAHYPIILKMWFWFHRLTAFAIIFLMLSRGNHSWGKNARDFTRCIITFLFFDEGCVDGIKKKIKWKILVLVGFLYRYLSLLLLGVTNHLSIKTEKEIWLRVMILIWLNFFFSLPFISFLSSFIFIYFPFLFTVRRGHNSWASWGRPHSNFLLMRIPFNFRNWLLSCWRRARSDRY